MAKWEHDQILRALASQANPVGELVRAFPGRDLAAADSSWLTDWITSHAQAIYNGANSPEIVITASAPDGTDLSCLSRPPITKKIRILACHPRYFRGYRTLASPIDLDADLLVVEGQNSTGKTGLSEAIEWSLTGSLSRRESGGYGHPRELDGCIANEFIPVGEETSVELILKVDDEEHRLKRVLLEDYSGTQISRATSEVSWDGEILDAKSEKTILESLFSGVHPLLMQHTLRQFVHDTPENRRLYFERLLQIDELTALIEKAVAGEALITQLTGPVTTTAVPQTATKTA